MTTEPSYQLFVDYVKWREGLVEEYPDSALLLLPKPLQQDLALPEELVVTPEPGVAEEDGSLLLMRGNPFVDRVIERLLQRGDVGTGRLPSLRTAPAEPALVELARQSFNIEHGRLDREDVPVNVLIPILRVGALITYSLDVSFQEREEFWVDGQVGSPLPRALADRIRLLEPAPAARGERLLAPDLRAALTGAHGELRRRAQARALTLARSSRPDMQQEWERAEAYYAAVLESIHRRRDQAAPERGPVYDAQADVTREERARRLEEIGEKYRPSFELRPFRLQLLMLPGLLVPLAVRRGERSYPLALLWEAVTGRFLPLICPHCAGSGQLVAGRQRLGCSTCLARPGAAAPAAPEPALGAESLTPVLADEIPRPTVVAVEGGQLELGIDRAPPNAGVQEPSPVATQSSDKPKAGGSSQPEPPAHRIQGPLPAPPSPEGGEGLEDLAQILEDYRERDRRASAAGHELAFRFWNRALGERRRWRRVAHDSPLTVLYELYGDVAPLLAIGIPKTVQPETVRSRTSLFSMELDARTEGDLRAGGAGYPFCLIWRLVAGKAVVSEVLPDLDAIVEPDREEWPYLFEPPQPRARLDPPCLRLWEVELPVSGLAFLARCFAAWRRVRLHSESKEGPELTAAALSLLVGRRARRRRNQEEVAGAHGVSVRDLSRVARRLKPFLERDRSR